MKIQSISFEIKSWYSTINHFLVFFHCSAYYNAWLLKAVMMPSLTNLYITTIFLFHLIPVIFIILYFALMRFILMKRTVYEQQQPVFYRLRKVMK